MKKEVRCFQIKVSGDVIPLDITEVFAFFIGLCGVYSKIIVVVRRDRRPGESQLYSIALEATTGLGS
jgi:hypothetical protein